MQKHCKLKWHSLLGASNVPTAMSPSDECFLLILSPVPTTVSSSLLVAIGGRVDQHITLLCRSRVNSDFGGLALDE